jgi:hypoxanthine phosphoribosyltransferase
MSQSDKKILFDRPAIEKRVEELAREISGDYAGGELLVIGILKGAFVFMADLVRSLTVPCRVDFMRVSSYGDAAESSGRITIVKDVELSLENRDVLIVDDIVDTGLTLKYIVGELKSRRPHSLKVCAFLDKRKRRKVEFKADYVGFTIDDGFVIGYGLDYAEKYRFLPEVYVLTAPGEKVETTHDHTMQTVPDEIPLR